MPHSKWVPMIIHRPASLLFLVTFELLLHNYQTVMISLFVSVLLQSCSILVYSVFGPYCSYYTNIQFLASHDHVRGYVVFNFIYFAQLTALFRFVYAIYAWLVYTTFPHPWGKQGVTYTPMILQCPDASPIYLYQSKSATFLEHNNNQVFLPQK